MMILPGMIEQRLAQQRMWFTSIPTLEAGSAVDVLDSAAEASARDLGENLKSPMQRGVQLGRRVEHSNFFPSVWLNCIMSVSMI